MRVNDFTGQLKVVHTTSLMQWFWSTKQVNRSNPHNLSWVVRSLCELVSWWPCHSPLDASIHHGNYWHVCCHTTQSEGCVSCRNDLYPSPAEWGAAGHWERKGGNSVVSWTVFMLSQFPPLQACSVFNNSLAFRGLENWIKEAKEKVFQGMK